MLIISWNVAGLKPALEKIAIDYAPPSSSSKSKTPSSAPFAHYLALHNSPAILCLQEHKIPIASLSSRCEPSKCSTVDGYESFWSCATNAKSRGFNGVVTYAKIGTVQSADVHPLKNEDLDSQGRCVLTDHGSFVLFNVYVPHGGRSSEGLVNKMNFLNALRRAMDEQRRRGKNVMLVGDMNAKIDKRDLYWRHRCLNVDFMREGLNGVDEIEVPRWKLDVAKNWDAICSVMQTIEVSLCCYCCCCN
jgi:exodeoxyribonuclease III